MSQASRFGRGLLIAVLGLSVGIAGVLGWRYLHRPDEAVRLVAERIAAGLAQGRIESAAFGPGVGQDEQKRLDQMLLGMGKLRPKVTVGAVAIGPDERSANVRLGFDWTIHEGKTHWTYDSFLTLRSTDGGWQGAWEWALLHPQLTAGQNLKASRLAAPRGELIGASEERLFWNTDAQRIGIDKTRVSASGAQEAARQLAVLVGIDPDRFAARVTGSGPRAFVEATLLRASGDDLYLTRKVLLVPGARAVPTVASMPIRNGFAQPLLGRVGDATADVIAASDGVIRDGDRVGLSGLQAARNSTLMGTTGFRVLAYQAANPTVEEELFRVEPVPGSSLALTLDARLQTAAEKVLAGVQGRAALVALRPSDGAILAAASGPGTSGDSISTRGRYPPGSVFKTATALAAIRSGLGPDDLVRCTSSITVDGKRFDNWQGYPASALGEVSLRTAFANSCNTAIIRLAQRVTPPSLAAAARDLGLGSAPDLGVTAFLGDVPAPTSEVAFAAQLIGQERILVSPLGAATMAASIAAGHTVQPALLRTDRPATEGGELTASEAASLRSLMATATTSGTGHALRGLPGGAVLSKTGTASYGSPVRFHAWTIAIQGDLAVAVFVADGVSGSVTAAPVVKRFLLAVR